MQKFFLRFITILEVLLFIGAYAVNYFTKKKMGMARYVVYVNQNLEKAYPMNLIIIFSIIVILVLTVAIVFCFFKSKKWDSKCKVINICLMICTSGLFVGFMLLKSIDNFRPYYFLGAIFVLIALLQIIKTWYIFRKE